MGQGTREWLPDLLVPADTRDSFPAGSGPCDLHAHTTASDGRLTPSALVKYAASRRLRALGIVDHDTVSGVRSLYKATSVEESGPDVLTPLVLDGVEVVPGVEINCHWEGREIHILGYYARFYEGPFRDFLERMKAAREDRVVRAAELLRELGLPIKVSRVMELSTGDSVGRPHIAQAMVEKGYVSSVKEAFERYLGVGKPAYVDRARLTPGEAIRAISLAGGVAVWAHPGTSGAMHVVARLVDDGLLGIEAYHPEHGHDVSRKCLELASQYNLVVTGGSDFHGLGAEEGGDLGCAVVGFDVVSTLRTLASSRR